MSKIFITYLLFQFVLFALTGYSQSRWVKIYHDEQDAPMKYIQKSYDKGYLLSGKSGANYSKYNWIIKTDVNGENLWEKTIGDGENTIVILDMAQDDLGNMFLVGGTRTYDSEDDPFLIKINSCGEKEWCKVFYTENNYDFSSCCTLTSLGDIVMVLNYTNPEPWVERICLAKLSSTGELIWKECYTSSDTSQRNEDTFDIILTPDNGFLITGFCDYEDPEQPNKWWLQPYYLKVDSVGNFEWETVLNKETNLDGGIAWNTVVSPDSLHFYSSISHHHHDTNLRSCTLATLDLQGNVVGVYDVIYGYKYGKLTCAQFINDSILAAEAGWGNVEDSVWTTAVLLDTLGNLIDTRVLLYDMYTSVLQITNDGKLLYASNTFQNGQFDCYLTKLNQDLEDDTIYTMPFTYDSLCPYPIVSDTIVQDDCGLIVGIDEVPTKEEYESTIKISPNPARDWIALTFPDITAPGKVELVLYNVFGQEVLNKASVPTNRMASLNISSLSSGIYFLRSKDKRNRILTGKFIVGR